MASRKMEHVSASAPYTFARQASRGGSTVILEDQPYRLRGCSSRGKTICQVREQCMPVLKAIFFDIGGTLGEVEPTSLKLHVFPDTVLILSAARALGFRLGIITNVPDNVGKDRVRAMLSEARIAEFFDDCALITSTEAASFKPVTAIYIFAANAMHLPAERCVYVDQNPAQVAGAVVAGMHGILRKSDAGFESRPWQT
jgi:FMN phosphatase YigB (HAD superfamily)